MCEFDDMNYGEDPSADMWMDYDYHVNTGELGDLFPEEQDDEEEYIDEE